MPNIFPVSDLRTYNDVLKNCKDGEPIFLTKNGRGKYVVLDIEEYNREYANKKTNEKPQKNKDNTKEGRE